MLSSRMSLPRLVRATRSFSTVRDTSASHLHSPAVYVMLKNERIDPLSIVGTGKAGRINKGDIILAIKAGTAKIIEHDQHHQEAPESSNNQSATTQSTSHQSAARLSASGRRTRVSLESILKQLNSVPESTPAAKPAAVEPAQYQRRSRRGWSSASSTVA